MAKTSMNRINRTTFTFVDAGHRELMEGLLAKTNITIDGAYHFITNLVCESVGKENCLRIGFGVVSEKVHRTPFLEFKASLHSLHGPVSVTSVTNNGEYLIQVYFRLEKKGGFCVNALEFVYALLLHLGVEKIHTLKIVQNHSFVQTQQVSYRGVLMDYSQYLRLTHRLLKSTSV